MNTQLDKSKIVDFLLLAVVGIGLLILLAAPLSGRYLSNYSSLDTLNYSGLATLAELISTSLFGFLLLAMVFVSLAAVGLLTVMRLRGMGLANLAGRSRLLETSFTKLQLKQGPTYRDTGQVGFFLALIYIIALVLLPTSLGSLQIQGGYSLLLFLIGVPLVLLSAFHLPFVQMKMGTLAMGPPPDAFLDVLSGPLTGARPELQPGELCTIGRDENNTLAMYNDPHISIQHHVCVYFQGARAILRAYHPVYINGRQVRPGDYQLRAGDEFHVGSSAIQYRVRG